MTTYGPWERDLCHDCGNEFQVSRISPVTIDGDPQCGDCSIKESAYREGFIAGHIESSNNKQGGQEMSDLCNYSNEDIQEMIVNNDDLMRAMVAIVKAGNLKTIGESSAGANLWSRHATDFIYEQLVSMAKSEIEAIS